MEARMRLILMLALFALPGGVVAAQRQPASPPPDQTNFNDCLTGLSSCDVSTLSRSSLNMSPKHPRSVI